MDFISEQIVFRGTLHWWNGSRHRFVPSDVNKFEENIFFYHFFHFFFFIFFHFFSFFQIVFFSWNFFLNNFLVFFGVFRQKIKFFTFFMITIKILMENPSGKYISDYQNNNNFHEKSLILINNIKKFACGGHPSGRLLQRRASLRRPAAPGLNCAGKTCIFTKTLHRFESF